jgi:DNA-binding response OmpR family regulator
MSHILIVDDNLVNRKLLARALSDLGHRTSAAVDGEEAIAMLRADPEGFDLVLLDILMPNLDGYGVLAEVKNDPVLCELPVIMITAVDELDSAILCIELGATDYLHKPFNPALLRARVGTSLAAKHLRDQERAYLQHVARVTAAAAEIEAASFDPASLSQVAARRDELGQLARVFQRMAQEIYARERRLRLQIEQLRLDIEEQRQAAGEEVAVYVPIDRRHALLRGVDLPGRASGAALLADLSGFTALTEALASELGLQRGAEELTRRLNRVYSALISEIDTFGGSVITFTGDAITCWFPENRAQKIENSLVNTAAHRAVTCAAALQQAMVAVGLVATPG